MSKLILVTGGARSGKSTFAEDMAKKYGEKILYVATSKAIDDEMKERIEKHRAQRPAHWQTLEAYKDLDRELTDVVRGKDAVLLDCITIMVTNLMLEQSSDWEGLTRERVQRVESEVKTQIETLIKAAGASGIPFILVTNEVGMGVVPPSAIGRDFRDIAGRMNQILARAADEVYFCVSGIPMKVKGEGI